MQKKLKPIKITYELIHGEAITDSQIIEICEAQQRRVSERVNAIILEYDTVPPELVSAIESERMIKSYILN